MNASKVTVIVLLAAIYFLAAKLGLSLAFMHASTSPVWPPSGIALAAVLTLGYGVWPGIWIGAFAINFLVNLFSPGAALMAALGSAFCMSAGNTLEALSGAFFANRWANGPKACSKSGDFFRFIALSVFLSPIIGATVGVTSLEVCGFGYGHPFYSIWFTWWLGDAVGIAVITPLLLIWSRPWQIPKGFQCLIEGSLFMVLHFMIGKMVFGGWIFSEARVPLSFLCLPLLVWGAFRFQQRGAALSIFLLSILALMGTLQGHGPFAMTDPNASLILLQAFIGTAAITSMTLACVVAELREASLELRKSIDLLAVRTAALSKSNQEMRREITQRKRVEAELARQTQDLVRSNKELENFAYVASHDLQEPLRMVGNYVQLLQKRIGPQLDAEARDFIGYVVDGARRMQSLINGLLEYSRADATKKPLQPVDCEEVLAKTLANLSLAFKESKARLTHDPLPVVQADTTQVVELFQNFISNALKFRGAEPPRIHVSAARRGEEWVFSFEDNGIGIPEEHGRRIFVIFQRLHSQSEYPGNGIGLALCKKIIEQRHGRVWFKSEPAKGSTFYFSLPASPGLAVAVNGKEDPDRREAL